MADIERIKAMASLIGDIKKKHKVKVARGYSGYGEGRYKDDISGETQCPLCGGTVDYVVSGYNGHTRGMCRTTKDCVGWIE